MPKVSILVPIYNQENYLREALDSLINQTLEDIEILCINDGSTDLSSQILEEYRLKDKRIKVINKSNSGYGETMNVGLNSATGDYIGILEPDDFAKNTMFEDLYKLAKENDADLVKADYYSYAANSKQARKCGLIPLSKANKKTNITKDISLLKLVPSIWSAIYKREFLNSDGIRFLETPGASFQDTSFFFKTMTLAKTVILIDKAYIYYRIDNENSSVNSKDKVFAICDEYDEITKFLNNKPEIKKIANDYKLKIQYRAYIWNLMRLSEQFLDIFIDKFSYTFKEFQENGEITKQFYKKIKKDEFQNLLHNKQKFRKIIDKKRKDKLKNKKTSKMISIRINSSRISIVLLGKQILEVSL